MKTIKIAIVDDHILVSNALEKMISLNPNFQVVMNCCNGQDFLDELQRTKNHPDVVLMDVKMPVKNGIETTAEISRTFPNVKVMALTVEDHDETIIKMMKAGAKGYLLKDMSPELLFNAITIVFQKGIFCTDMVSQSLLKIKTEEKFLKDLHESLKDREREFIKLACSELTYRQIADRMCVSPRTIDGYRDSVFLKLNVKTRVGIVLFAIKHNLC